MPTTRQRHHFYYDPENKNVTGIFYQDGKRVRRTLCSWEKARITGLDKKKDPEFKTDKDAAWCERFLNVLREKKLDELSARKKEKTSLAKQGSIQKVMAEWIEVSEATRRPGTVRGYVLMQGQYSKLVGNHPVAGFNARKMDRFIIGLKSRKITNFSINNRLNSLKAFFRWACEREEIASLPKIPLLKTTKKKAKALTASQMRKFLAAIVEHMKNAHDGRQEWFCRLHMRAAMLALGTGMRPGEIWSIPWGNIDLEMGEASVIDQPHFEVKDSDEKTVSITRTTLEFLKTERKRYPDEIWLMDNGRGEIAFASCNSIGNRFAEYFRELGFNGQAKPFHGLRAFYATQALREGVDLATLQQQLGHSDIRVTASYQSGVSDFKKRAAIKIDRAVSRVQKISGFLHE